MAGEPESDGDRRSPSKRDPGMPVHGTGREAGPDGITLEVHREQAKGLETVVEGHALRGCGKGKGVCNGDGYMARDPGVYYLVDALKSGDC